MKLWFYLLCSHNAKQATSAITKGVHHVQHLGTVIQPIQLPGKVCKGIESDFVWVSVNAVIELAAIKGGGRMCYICLEPFVLMFNLYNIWKLFIS